MIVGMAARSKRHASPANGACDRQTDRQTVSQLASLQHCCHSLHYGVYNAVPGGLLPPSRVGGAGGRFCALLQKAIPGEMQPQCNGKSEGGTAFGSITPRKSFVFVGNAVPVSRERSGKIEPHWMDVLGEGNPYQSSTQTTCDPIFCCCSSDCVHGMGVPFSVFNEPHSLWRSATFNPHPSGPTSSSDCCNKV